MKAVLGVAGLCFLLFANYAEAGQHGHGGAECTDGSQWHDQCNSCWCANGGAACTRMGCPDNYDELYNGGRSFCKDGSRWLKDDCNWCDCVDGVAVCTYRACLPGWALDRDNHNHLDGDQQETNRSLTNSLSGTECKITADAADRWREGCNWCKCSEFGNGTCTLRGCSAAIVERLEGTKECEGHPSWKKDCNWCTCNNGRASCTKMVCAEEQSSEGEDALTPRAGIIPGSIEGVADVSTDEAPPTGATTGDATCRNSDDRVDRWRDGCNWCRCLNGKGACTKRGCPPALIARLAGTKECEGNAQWRTNCNWCRCDNETAVCTRKACINRGDFTPVGRQPEAEPECVQGSSWTDSCNSCRCSGGVSTCTRKACLRAVPDTCQEGALWRKDCNWCSCSEGVPVCTEKLCLETSRPDTGISVPSRPTLGEEARCANGSRWRKDGCNWCYCSEGNGVCTSRACLTDTETTESNKLECIEGSSWSNGCNSCFCNNGRAVCGRKACIAGSSPRGEAVAPDMSRPQVQDRPRGAAVAPDMSRPQVQDRPRTEAVAPDMNRPQIQDRPRGAAVAPDMNRPQVQDRPRASLNGDVIQSRNRISLPVDDRDCIPGSRVILDGCNWCSCHERGSFACTLMACFASRDPALKMCEEGSRWRKGCNWCDCVEGQGVCTKLACLADEVRRSSPAVDEPAPPPADAQCTEGSRWRDECNWCSCSNGIGVCTLRACLPDYESDEPVCEAGSSWKRGCNWCRCTDKGVGLCTMKACAPPRPSALESTAAVAVAGGGRGRSSDQLGGNMQCRPGSRFRQKCNWCTCSSQGIKLCSKKMCRPGADLSSQPLCEGDAMFLDEENCNWCSCHNGVAACTLKLCFSGPSPFGGGQRARTLSASPQESQPNTENAECVEGTSWLDECNRCRCRNGLKICTRRMCFSQTAVTPEASEPRSDQDRCQLPVDSGPCFASFRVFRFNSESNRCEAFLYGGCQGNDNRFDTPEECQQTCGRSSRALDSSCDRTKCPEYRQNSYMAVKGCTPVYDDDRCCASSYSCQESTLSPGPGQCLYQGVLYSLGDSVPVEDECAQCRCSRDGKISCANSECPSMFRGREPGCRPLYRPGQCCEYDQDCSGKVLLAIGPVDVNDPATVPAPRAAPICEAEGKSYLEGDKMFFEDHQCQSCICGPEYSGPYGSGCKTINCGYDFRYTDRIQQGCVPLFFKQRCCPITFICPGDRRIAEDQSGANPDGAINNVCRFADTVVAVGQQLATKEAKVTCTCNTPPDITCVQTEN